MPDFPQDSITLIEKTQAARGAERRTLFDELVRRYRPMVYGRALTLVSDPHLAEDITQETFLIAYLRLDQLRQPQAFAGWLRRIAFTQADRTQRGLHPSLEPIEMVEMFDARQHPSSEAHEPEPALEAAELRQALRAAVDALPAGERHVTEGFYLRGQSTSELAEQMQVPQTTIRKRLQYARQHLRVLLSGINSAMDQAVAGVLQQSQPQPQRVPVPVRSARLPEPDEPPAV